MGFVRIEVDELKQYIETNRNVIGSNTEVSPLRELTEVTTDFNAVHVDGVNGDDTTGTGVRANPVKTVDKAVTLISPVKHIIQIIDDTNPYEFDFRAVTITNLLVQSDLGLQPQFYLKTWDGEFDPDTGSANDWKRYYIETWEDRIYFVDVSKLYRWDGSTSTYESVLSVYEPLHNIKKFRFKDGSDSDNYHDNMYITCKTNATGNVQIFLIKYPGSGYGLTQVNISSTPLLNPPTDFAFFDKQPFPSYLNNHWVFIISENQKLAYLQPINEFTYIHTFPNAQMTHEENMNVCNVFRNYLYVGCDDGLYYIDTKKGELKSVSTIDLQLSKIANRVNIEYNPISSISCCYVDQTIETSTDRATNNEGDRLYIGYENGKIYEYNPTANKWTFIIQMNDKIMDVERKQIGRLCDVLYIAVDNAYKMYRYNMVTKELTYFDMNQIAFQVKYWENYTDQFYDGFVLSVRQNSDPTAVLNASCARILETIKLPKQLKINGIKFVRHPDTNYQTSGFELTDTTASGYFEMYWSTITDLSSIFYCRVSNILKELVFKRCLFEKLDYGITGLNGVSSDYTIGFYSYTYSRDAKYNLDIFDCIFEHIRQETIVGHIYGVIRNSNFNNALFGIYYNNSDNTKSLDIRGNVFIDIAKTGIESVDEKATEGRNCFFRCKDNVINSTSITDWDDILQSPLFKNILLDQENYHLLQKITGAEFDSPCAIGNGYQTWLTSITVSSLPYTSTQIDIELGNIIGGFVFEITGLSGTSPVLDFNIQEYDGSTWNTIETIQVDTVMFYYMYSKNTFKDLRLYITLNSGVFTQLRFNAFYWTRDVGAVNVSRDLDTNYNNTPEYKISYKPISMTYQVIKNEESVLSDIDGMTKVLSRPVQSKHLVFTWQDNSKQKEEELYQLSELANLNRYKLKIYFEDRFNQTGTSVTITNNAIKTNEYARVYFKSSYYDVTENMKVVNDSTKTWNRNEWKGFWVYLKNLSTSEEFYKKILFNTETLLYIEDIEGEIDESELHDYEIKYFRCVLGTTSLEMLKRIYNFYQQKEGYFGNIVNQLDFWES